MSLKFRNIHRNPSVLKCLINKVAGFEACNFINKRLQHRCFPMNIAKFLKTPILKNIIEWLLLQKELGSSSSSSGKPFDMIYTNLKNYEYTGYLNDIDIRCMIWNQDSCNMVKAASLSHSIYVILGNPRSFSFYEIREMLQRKYHWKNGAYQNLDLSIYNNV